ncbi:hypothetical protein GMA8713_05169 [Grimontia marina]|uniref:Uncharacterized protein n=1 Tax=Grimontia marina TaxID=646534 RepID=A0A128FK04_9GAMM|nr:hypothetical protein GMA8713_05169 [Grimontia marina]
MKIDSVSANEKAMAETLAEQPCQMGFELTKLPVPEHITNGFNIFNEKGLKTVNLSTGMAKVNTTEEFIAIADLVAISEFVRSYLTR